MCPLIIVRSLNYSFQLTNQRTHLDLSTLSQDASRLVPAKCFSHDVNHLLIDIESISN